MMYNYPFFSFPHFRRYTPYSPYINRPISKGNSSPCNDIPTPKEKVTSFPLKDEPSYDEVFEIFGIKLYYDDILLICLIFFLYQEGVQDDFLFIALVLLLLS